MLRQEILSGRTDISIMRDLTWNTVGKFLTTRTAREITVARMSSVNPTYNEIQHDLYYRSQYYYQQGYCRAQSRVYQRGWWQRQNNGELDPGWWGSKQDVDRGWWQTKQGGVGRGWVQPKREEPEYKGEVTLKELELLLYASTVHGKGTGAVLGSGVARFFAQFFGASEAKCCLGTQLSVRLSVCKALLLLALYTFYSYIVVYVVISC